MHTLVGSSILRCTPDCDSRSTVEAISSWLGAPAEELDRALSPRDRTDALHAVRSLNERSADGDADAFYHQQLLLSRIYELTTRLPDASTAEGSTVLHEVTRSLETATLDAENSHIDEDELAAAPAGPDEFLSWLKETARRHRAFKHPYYVDYLRDRASREDLRTYVIQESVVDGRFDDLLAMMQVGTTGAAKMEIARNFWDEMGNGDPAQVHTHLFELIYEGFDISAADLEQALSAQSLLSGNLTVLVCRYRRLYPEAVGFLGMTEWFAPDRFVHVVRAWERLGLPPTGIKYHQLHITVDSLHAAGWFHNVIKPSVSSQFMQRGVARGAMWRLNSSARYLDERLAQATIGR